MAFTFSKLYTRSLRQVSTLTESAPAAAVEGFRLAGITCVLIRVTAQTGSTFTGTGDLLGSRNPDGAGWIPAQSRNENMVQGTGVASFLLDPIDVRSKRGGLLLLPSGVTLSGGGTTMTIDYLAVGDHEEM